jgi:hypothetical protein
MFILSASSIGEPPKQAYRNSSIHIYNDFPHI